MKRTEPALMSGPAVTGPWTPGPVFKLQLLENHRTFRNSRVTTCDFS